MRHIPLLLAFAAALLLGGCATPQVSKPGYAAYLEFVGQQQARANERVAGIAAAAQSCNDARCVENVAAMAALASVSGGGNAVLPAPPPRELSGAEKFAAVAGALSPLAGVLVNGAVQWHQADTSRDVSLAQYGALDHITSSTVGAMANVATGATPSITVGGDYVPGTQIGGDAVGGSQTRVGGDQIGRDRVDNNGLIGDYNHWQSPVDNHAGDCRDSSACPPATGSP